jgi:hypothetical protein
VRIFVRNFAHETAGAASTRHSLLPLFLRVSFKKNSDAICVARTRTHTRLLSPAKVGDPVFQRQQ